MPRAMTLYWWPGCGTCRVSRAYLMERNASFEERDFFKQPLSKTEWCELLGGESARTVFNFASRTFKASGLDAASLSDEQLLDLLASEPRYLKRPLLAVDGKLVAGATAQVLQRIV
ncbi:MAG: hypothetical protein FJ318_09440 [SAR202 cluster bacterium]|nr:hypothetical protein [SAR202 cluster bacterium]